MNSETRQKLKEKLNGRVSFEKADLMVYQSDIAGMPGIIMSCIDFAPEAAVVASSVQDVVSTLKIAAETNTPVTPRGQGSSGYGGSIPTKSGILLDLTTMDRILNVDESKLIVDVEPGVIWNNLSHELLKKGMDNKIYPTSAPSSTVAGWLAQGGQGIGSLKYGSIRDVVEEVDVVGLDGNVNTYKGDDADLYESTCGIIGVITRVRLACRKAEGIRPFSVTLPNANAVQKFVLKTKKELDPYTLILHSPGYVQMRKESGSDEPIPEGAYLVIVGVEESSADPAKMGIAAEECGGYLQADHIAQSEWDMRCYPMRIKKLGPDLVVSEFYLPEDRFADAWNEIERDLSADLVGMEAVAVSGNRIAVLTYILDNAEEFLYHLRVSKSVRAIQIAKRFGGSIYSAGLWFAISSKDVLGDEKYDRVMKIKKEIDSGNLLNPGKITAPKVKWLPFIDVCTFMTIGSQIVLPLGKILTYKRPKIKSMEKINE